MKEIDYDNIELDEEEQWIEDHLDEFKPAPKWVGKSLREAAKNPPIIESSNKSNENTVTLNFKENDVVQLKEEAGKQGITYQALITNIVHKYLKGILIDANEIKS